MILPSSSRFPRGHQLRKGNDFREVFKSGNRCHTEHFTILYKDNSRGFPRLGLIVGKGVFASAVKRNRLKRLVREVYRQNSDLFNSFDIVIKAENKQLTLNYDLIRKEICEQFRLS